MRLFFRRLYGTYARLGRDAASSARVTALAALTALPLATAPAAAQDTTRAELDSLRDRLRRAEEAIELLRKQLATQAEGGVQSATRVRVELFGRVMMNAFSNSARVNNADVPLFVAPNGAGGRGATIRQTSIGVAVSVGRVIGGDFLGDLHADFFGGQQPSTGGRHFPLLRIRTARGLVTWRQGELLFGQDVPLLAGLNPVSVAAFGTPEFAGAGNLWLWLPQLRATAALGTRAFALQGAALAPTSGDPAAAFDTDLDPAERSKRPYLQGRLRARWGTEGEPGASGEIGVGIHRGWLRRADGSLAISEALALDVRLAIGAGLELRGEVYRGQALRGLGGGGIGQGLTMAGEPVDDRGGWAQLVVRPDPRVELAAGCGAADPDDEDAVAGRLKNVACSAHAALRPGGPILLALGYRTHQTTYAAGPVRNHHVNVGLGFEF